MKKILQRTVILLLSACTLIPLLSVNLAAATYRTGANAASTSYQKERYYDSFTKIPLTGDGRTDVLAIALSQLGYQEGNSVDQLGGVDATSGNFTEYNYNMGDFSQGYGGKNYPWCASFVSFCLYQARCTDQNSISDWCRKHEGDSRYIWREVSCNKWAAQLRLCGYFQSSIAFGGSYLPQSADLIFFTNDGQKESHIGLVLYVSGSTVYTVEGNTSSASGLESNGGGVYVKSYSLSDSCIRGYGVLPYQTAQNLHPIDYSGATPTSGIYVATTNKYVYTTAEASSYKWLLPKYSLFAVLGTASNNRLRAVCRIDGQWVEGYVKNNTDRVIQLSSLGVKEADTPLLFSSACKTLTLSNYKHNQAVKIAYGSSFTAAPGDTLGISGRLELNVTAAAIGYYLDGDRSTAVWTPLNKTSTNFNLSATLPDYDALLHTLTFAVQLSDGSVYVIDTLTFALTEPPATEPPTEEPTAPPTEAPTEAPTTPEETFTPTVERTQEETFPTATEAVPDEITEPTSGTTEGCDASLASASAVLALSASAVICLCRKKEDSHEH